MASNRPSAGADESDALRARVAQLEEGRALDKAAEDEDAQIKEMMARAIGEQTQRAETAESQRPHDERIRMFANGWSLPPRHR